MEAAENVPKIYLAIANVIADIGYVAKDKINKQQGFKFRSVDDVYNTLHPALAKNKVFIVPTILEQDRTIKATKSGTEMTLVICKIKFTFYAEDGSYIESIIIGEGLDTGDKATNKAMAIAYKYACFQVFCIPTEEMIDPDSERPELEQGNSAKNQNKVPDKMPAEKKPPKAKEQDKPAEADPNIEKVTDIMVQTMKKELERTGVAESTIISLFKMPDLNSFTISQFNKVMKKFAATPDKKEAPHE